MTWLVVLWDILCLAVYPVTVLAPLFISLLGVLAAPIFHVVRVLVRICLLPLRILANLEVSRYCLLHCFIDCLFFVLPVQIASRMRNSCMIAGDLVLLAVLRLRLLTSHSRSTSFSV